MPEIEVAFDWSLLGDFLSDPLVFSGLLVLALFFFLVLTVVVLRRAVKTSARLATGFKLKVFLITVPKASADDQADVSLQQLHEKIGFMETFFSTIAGLKAQRGFKTWLFGTTEHFSLEIVADDGKILFYIAMPEHLEQYLQQQLQAQFPDAFMEEVLDYNIFSPKAIIKAKYLGFGKQAFFPIKTYKKFDSDPLNAIVNALSKIDAKDGAAVQIVLRSARASWRDPGIKLATLIQQGKKMSEALRQLSGGSILGDIKAAWGGTWGVTKKDAKPEDAYRLSPMEEEVVKGLEEKASKAGVDANIRILASGEQAAKVDLYLNNIVNAFSQYNVYNYGNGFKPLSKSLKVITRDFIFRNFNEGAEKLVLNTEELAGLYHLPIPLINEIPNIQWLEAKKAPAPLNTPSEGVILGKNIFRGQETVIHMKREDRRRHMYIIGMTGTGKSFFQSGLAMQDIAAGEGVCFIDPHGDDLEEILARVPKSRAEDVIFIDPSDTERPIGLNMLEYDNKEQLTFVVNEVMAVFDKLYDLKSTGGPMFEQYFKNACYLVMDHPESGSTLMEIPRVLADEDFRKLKLAHCTSPVVKDFWEKEALKAGGEASLQNMVPYITSKLTPFTANDIMRPIISQQKSSVNFAEAMNSGKIILVKLAKGKLGKINADLLGMIIITKILMAALGRADLPAAERRDFYLYIDEFQNFLTDSIEVILSEARKYKLCLTMGHQYIGQMVKGGDTKFKDAIFGNVGTKVSFRIGVDDAETLAKEFEPVFDTNDFLNVPKYNCFVKMLIDNANPPGFNMATFPHDALPVAPHNDKLAGAIKQLSRLKYGKPRDLVERESQDRLQALEKMI